MLGRTLLIGIRLRLLLRTREAARHAGDHRAGAFDDCAGQLHGSSNARDTGASRARTRTRARRTQHARIARTTRMKRSHGGSSSASVAKRVDDKATVTIAIDFGTAGTGYAYCFAGSDVIEAKQPGGQDARKTLTNLLLDRNGAFKAFGFEARRMYSESGQGDFFSNYKMLLENVGSVGGATMVRALTTRRALPSRARLPPCDRPRRTMGAASRFSTSSRRRSATSRMRCCLHRSSPHQALRPSPCMRSRARRLSRSAAARSPTASWLATASGCSPSRRSGLTLARASCARLRSRRA